jgi:hypothetical protein
MPSKITQQYNGFIAQTGIVFETLIEQALLIIQKIAGVITHQR